MNNLLNYPKIVSDVFQDLLLLNSSDPNEWLPREEQVRSRIYASILPNFQHVSLERCYEHVRDAKSKKRVDLWTRMPGVPDNWIEIKVCYNLNSFNNKPKEQLQSWKNDLLKLSELPKINGRVFLLFGIFNFDPMQQNDNKISQSISDIGVEPAFKASMKFKWQDTDANHAAAWCYQWDNNVQLNIQ